MAPRSIKIDQLNDKWVEKETMSVYPIQYATLQLNRGPMMPLTFSQIPSSSARVGVLSLLQIKSSDLLWQRLAAYNTQAQTNQAQNNRTQINRVVIHVLCLLLENKEYWLEFWHQKAVQQARAKQRLHDKKLSRKERAALLAALYEWTQFQEEQRELEQLQELRKISVKPASATPEAALELLGAMQKALVEITQDLHQQAEPVQDFVQLFDQISMTVFPMTYFPEPAVQGAVNVLAALPHQLKVELAQAMVAKVEERRVSEPARLKKIEQLKLRPEGVSVEDFMKEQALRFGARGIQLELHLLEVFKQFIHLTLSQHQFYSDQLALSAGLDQREKQEGFARRLAQEYLKKGFLAKAQQTWEQQDQVDTAQAVLAEELETLGAEIKAALRPSPAPDEGFSEMDDEEDVLVHQPAPLLKGLGKALPPMDEGLGPELEAEAPKRTLVQRALDRLKRPRAEPPENYMAP